MWKLSDWLSVFFLIYKKSLVPKSENFNKLLHDDSKPWLVE